MLWLHTVSFALLAAALLPSVRLPHWWVRVFDFPRAQALVLALICLGLDLRLLDLSDSVSQAATLAVAVAVGLELFRVAPYTQLNSVELMEASDGDPNNRLRILSCNVLQSNSDAARLLALIARRDPDIVFLLEIDDAWLGRVRELETRYPFRVVRPQDDTYGMALYSKLELVEPEIREIRKEHVPSIKTGVRMASGRIVRLYGLHPDPPAPEYAETTSQRDAELVLVGREAKLCTEPIIVAGDLNDVAWSHTTRLFRRLSGLLDPRIGRGTLATFPVALPFLRFPLDHIFVSTHFALHELDRLEDVGSDHFPVWADLQLQSEAEDVHDEPKPEGDDRKEAREIVTEANDELRDGDTC